MTGAKTPDDAKWRDFEERLDGDGANRTPPVGAFTARSKTGMVVSDALEIYGPEFDSRQLHQMFVNTNLGPLRRDVPYFSQIVPSLSLPILAFDL